jgi:hypothetical protein
MSKRKRDYHLVAVDGVATAGELQAIYDAALHRQRKLYGATKFTVEALMYSLRERGDRALAEPDCQRRLSELSSDQLVEVISRLMKLRSKYPAITDQLLFRLNEKLP